MRAAFLAYMPLFACTGATVSATDHRIRDVWPPKSIALVRLSWTTKIGPLRVLPTSTKEHLMAVTLYSGFVPVCVQLLTGLKTVLKKAEDHATTQKWDTAVVLNLRFYPDMFPLERQVRQVCNHAL